MARWLKLLLLLVLVLLVTIAASGWIVRGLLTSSARTALLDRLGRAAGVKLQVETVEFDLPGWYRLQPAVELRGVKVGNPPGFQSPWLLEADRLAAGLELRPLVSGAVRVTAVRLERPRFQVETAKNGTTNLEAFVKSLSSTEDTESSRRELSIDQLQVSDAEIQFVDAKGRQAQPPLRSIDLAMEGFAPGQPCRFELSAGVYRGEVSQIQVNGDAGPFSAESMPVDANLRSTLNPSDIPPAIRKEQFGDLLANPPAAARMTLAGSLKGDVYRTLSGSARVGLAGFEVGNDPAHRLPVSGEIPASVSISRIMSSPVIEVRARNAVLKAGAGQWKGNVDLISAGGILRGASSGSLRGVEIDRFLSAFSSSRDQVDGKLDIPSYTLRFAGRDADQIRNSLTGDARLEVSQGKVKALDLLGAILRAWEKKGAASGAGTATEFTTLSTNLSLGGRQLVLENLSLSGPGLNAAGGGMIGFNQSLDIKLNSRVAGRIAELLGQKASEGKPAEVMVPVQIAGTLSNPSVRPDFGKVATGAAKSLLFDFLRKQMERKSKQPPQ
jgi:uncharacterized protein involved in outer membrane biogenesis